MTTKNEKTVAAPVAPAAEPLTATVTGFIWLNEGASRVMVPCRVTATKSAHGLPSIIVENGGRHVDLFIQTEEQGRTLAAILAGQPVPGALSVPPSAQPAPQPATAPQPAAAPKAEPKPEPAPEAPKGRKSTKRQVQEKLAAVAQPAPAAAVKAAPKAEAAHTVGQPRTTDDEFLAALRKAVKGGAESPTAAKNALREAGVPVSRKRVAAFWAKATA